VSDIELFIVDTFGPLAMLVASASVAWMLMILVIGAVAEIFARGRG
jgi:hypothetical protein